MKLHEAIERAAARGGAAIRSDGCCVVIRANKTCDMTFDAHYVLADWTIEPERFGPEEALRRFMAGKKVRHEKWAPGSYHIKGPDNLSFSDLNLLTFSNLNLDDRWEEVP